MNATKPMIATVAIVLGTTTFAGEASADVGPWKPFPTGVTKTYDPKVVCPFGLHAEVIEDDELGREFTDESGNVVAVEIVGSLVFRFTNMATGKSVVRDANGHGWTFNHPDKSQTLTCVGPFAAASREGQHPPNFPTGYYILSGVTVIEIPANGPYSIAYTAPIENICETLASP